MAIVVATFWVTLAAHKSDISSAVFVEHTADREQFGGSSSAASGSDAAGQRTEALVRGPCVKVNIRMRSGMRFRPWTVRYRELDCL